MHVDHESALRSSCMVLMQHPAVTAGSAHGSASMLVVHVDAEALIVKLHMPRQPAVTASQVLSTASSDTNKQAAGAQYPAVPAACMSST